MIFDADASQRLSCLQALRRPMKPHRAERYTMHIGSLKRASVLSLVLLALVAAMPAPAIAFAALAVDTSKGTRHGWWAGDSDKARAQSSARSQCGNNCGVVLTWDTGCAAYNVDMAAGSSIMAFGTGLTANAAKTDARRACLAKGGINCTTRVWACDRLASSPVSGGNQ